GMSFAAVNCEGERHDGPQANVLKCQLIRVRFWLVTLQVDKCYRLERIDYFGQDLCRRLRKRRRLIPYYFKHQRLEAESLQLSNRNRLVYPGEIRRNGLFFCAIFWPGRVGWL